MTNDSRYIIFAMNTVKRLSECIISKISKIPEWCYKFAFSYFAPHSLVMTSIPLPRVLTRANAVTNSS